MISADGLIEATVEPGWGGVHLRGRGVPSTWHVAIEATANGTTRRVWGADPATAPGGSCYAFDALPSFGVEVEYRVAATDSLGVVTGTWSAPASVVVASHAGVWLRDPAAPALAVSLMPVSWSGWSRSRRGGHVQVLNGGAVPFYSGRDAGTGTLDLLALTDDDHDRLADMVDVPRSVLLSGSSAWAHLGDVWVSLDDLTEGRLAPTLKMHASRSWPISVTRVPAPSTRGTQVAAPLGLATTLPGLAADLDGGALDLSLAYP